MQGGGSLIWLIGLFVLMYFLMIRPQQKSKKQRQELLDSVKKGEDIVTIGGIHGTITALNKDTMILAVAPNVEIKMSRTSVAYVVSDEDDDEEDDDDLDLEEDTNDEADLDRTEDN